MGTGSRANWWPHPTPVGAPSGGHGPAPALRSHPHQPFAPRPPHPDRRRQAHRRSRRSAGAVTTDRPDWRGVAGPHPVLPGAVGSAILLKPRTKWSVDVADDWNQAIIDEFRANAGKVGGPFAGAPLLILTSTGAKSGQPRLPPLVYRPEGDDLVIFASKRGAPT